MASTRPRPASDAARAAHAALGLGEHGARHAGGARHRRRRHLVEADDAHDLLDEIGGRRATSGRQLGAVTFTVAPLPSMAKPSASRVRADLLLLELDAGELLDEAEREGDDGLGSPAARRQPCALDGVPPATSIIMAVARSRPGRMKAGIDAALEAVARVA